MLALAPDDSSRKAARGLAKPGPWSELGSTDALVWGKCQGSGKTPYQVIVTAMDTVRSFKTVVAISVVEAELFPEISFGDAPQSHDQAAMSTGAKR